MRESNRLNVLSRLKALRDALDPDARISKALGASCRSQNAFAALKEPSLGIEDLSLNTLKLCANAYIEDGGWIELNRLRKLLHQAWLATASTNKSTKRTRNSAPRSEITHLRSSIDVTDRFRLKLVRAYLDLLRVAESAATRDQQLFNELNSHRACWMKELGLPLNAQV